MHAEGHYNFESLKWELAASSLAAPMAGGLMFVIYAHSGNPG